MLARLGEVLFWGSCVLAGLILLVGAVLFWNTDTGDFVVYAALTALAAVLSVLIGRGAMYVLAGR